MLEKFAKKRKNGRGTRMGRKDKGVRFLYNL